MTKVYAYVGPTEIAARVAGDPLGAPIDARTLPLDEPQTYVVTLDGTLRTAHRRSEHVACAGGGPVLAAGELTASRVSGAIRIIDISNQSTGFCPEPECWPAVERALDAANIAHPGRFTTPITFRRCDECGERNLVKDEWFECAICGAELSRVWNFDAR